MARIQIAGASAEVARQLYYPYGEERWSSGTLATDYQFTGQRNEAGIGLMDYNARFYDPYLNRFISPDTIVPDPANPQSFNRYSYVYNNPLKYTDPSGHNPNVPPIRVNTIRRFGDVLAVDLVDFSPGTDGSIDTANWDETLGARVDKAGFRLGVAGILVDALEIGLPAGVDEVAAVADVLLTIGSSACQGETYYGQPHPDLPLMIVLGPDVLVNGAELAVGASADAAGFLAGPFTGGGSSVASWGIDAVTSLLSGVYDSARLFSDIPSQWAIGYYQDDQGTLRIVLLNYRPAEDGGETTHLGQSQLAQ